jgi:hypothetical protein
VIQTLLVKIDRRDHLTKERACERVGLLENEFAGADARPHVRESLVVTCLLDVQPIRDVPRGMVHDEVDRERVRPPVLKIFDGRVERERTLGLVADVRLPGFHLDSHDKP